MEESSKKMKYIKRCKITYVFSVWLLKYKAQIIRKMLLCHKFVSIYKACLTFGNGSAWKDIKVKFK